MRRQTGWQAASPLRAAVNDFAGVNRKVLSWWRWWRGMRRGGSTNKATTSESVSLCVSVVSLSVSEPLSPSVRVALSSTYRGLEVPEAARGRLPDLERPEGKGCPDKKGGCLKGRRSSGRRQMSAALASRQAPGAHWGNYRQPRWEVRTLGFKNETESDGIDLEQRERVGAVWR